MSVTNPERVVTKQDLADFYDELLPFISPKSYAGFTPIGTVISIFGESAPANYLICDGATYNVADYPELCAHLWSLTTNSQYKVSGDATKFKVPDLRGEFLRGTGTNSHTYGGDGSNVGVHQSATIIPQTVVWNGSTSKFGIMSDRDSNGNNLNTAVQNTDKANQHYNQSATDTPKWNSVNGSFADTSATGAYYSTRPTNTSVLFCIATKNIYLDPKNDYSTDEKVIGTWITGETLYQRTLVDTMPVISTDGTVVGKPIDITDWNMKSCISVSGMAYTENNYVALESCWNLTGAGSPQYFIRSNVDLSNATKYFTIRCNRSALSEADFFVTIQYTKATT